ncbi:MAG: SMI1/KNR4 family protein [Planctomycetota bacterium]|nr:SMI1/KNR4 family protein [Planctomycetota bacterium]
MAKSRSPAEVLAKLRPEETDTPATQAAIKDAERVLGVRLPEELRSLLLVRNGARLRLNRFTLKKKPPAQSFARKSYHIRSIPGVGGGSGDDIVELRGVAADEWGLAERLVPLFGDGHWWCCLDYRVSGPNGEPSITHVEPGETSADEPLEIPIAGSFADLVAGLSRDPESLTPALIALDEGAPTRQHLEAVLDGLGYKKWSWPGSSQRTPPPAWETQKYSSFVNGCDARIELWTNRLYDISQLLTVERPEKHPMLRVSVSPKDEEACLRELLDALGTGAVLLHGLE